ncbi:MAG: family 4 glycosyl hydrolase [Candidatus Hodarchaeales archaeon]|jgi:alpha-galactosidase
MDSDANIVIIGAGSASFGLINLSGIIANEDLQNATIKLVDIHEQNLKAIKALGELMKREWKSTIKIESFIDRKQALIDADYVILSVAIDREETWLKDFQIAKKYNFYHYAENGLMGSFGHTARGLNFIMPILNDIHDLARNSWLINFTNPVPRIGYAAEYVGIKSIGLCHQIWHGYGILGRYLANDLGITRNLDFEVKWTDESEQKLSEFAIKASKEYDIKAAGLNHFTWMIDVRRQDTNEDVYPLIRQEANNVHPNFEPLTQHIFKIFGLLPVPGDCHLTEYLPYTFLKQNWEKYRIQLYDFERGKRVREAMWRQINEIISGDRELDIKPTPSERADAIIGEMLTNSNAYEQAVNIPNQGAITNLPNDAIVEVPALISSFGVSGMRVGRLPEAIATLCQREISIAKLITKSSILGDREAALQAFALMLPDLSIAEQMLDDYLKVHKKYLPLFHS